MTLPAGLGDFEGEWRVARQINDARAGQVIAGQGTARWSPAPSGLIYAETLALQVPGHPAVTATRLYLWRDAGDRIDVRFDDDRPFHAIRLGQAVARDLHHCTPDIYNVCYTFTDWPMFDVCWTAQGPRKDYVMITRYERLDCVDRTEDTTAEHDVRLKTA